MDLRVQRDDAVVEDRRHAGDVVDRGHGDAGVGDRLGGAARRHELARRARCSPRANSTMPVLSYTESRALVILVRVMPSCRHSRKLSQHFGIDPPLDLLDAFVEGLDGVVGEDGHRLLRQDRTLVDLQARQVHGAAGDLDARGERVVDRVPALERGQQRRMGVDDAIGERVVDRLRQDGAEARHRDEVDLVAAERVEHLVGVGDAVEVGAEGRALDQLGGDAGLVGDAERAARAVGEHHRDGEVVVEHGAQDRAAPRRQHRQPTHRLNVAESPPVRSARGEDPCNVGRAVMG